MGIVRALRNNDLVTGVATDLTDVYPVTSDMAVYNTYNVTTNSYMYAINVNAFKNETLSYSTKTAARQTIPEDYRHNGLIITYKYDNDWEVEQFIGTYSSESDWDKEIYWKSLNTKTNNLLGSLNTNNNESNDPVVGESFNNVINLHKITKTGKNTDLIEFVGQRVGTSEIFNDYSTVQIEGLQRNSNYVRENAEYSHVEGSDNVCYESYSHLEGTGNKAKTGTSVAHIEGLKNIAEVEYGQTAPNGGFTAAHMEGFGNTYLNALASHVEGWSNTVKHNYAHVAGMGNISGGKSMFVFGEYAKVPSQAVYKIDNRGDFVEIVGNGISDSGRSNARMLSWDGIEWTATDVYCGGTFENPLHKLSTKIGIEQLESDYTYHEDDSSRIPASIKSVNEVFRLLQGSKKAYYFDWAVPASVSGHPDTTSMVHELLENTTTFEVGSQLLIKETNITDFWICEYDEENDHGIFDDSTLTEELLDNQTLVDKTLAGEWIGHYKIAHLETQSVDLDAYQLKLVKGNNIKTIFGHNPLIEVGDDERDINPTQSVVVPSNTSMPVSGQAVIDYVQNNAITISNLKVLNTQSTESLPIVLNESLVKSIDNGVLNLHKISKTGNNIDLVDYVGVRNNSNTIVFNNYSDNPFENINGSYSSIFGQGNKLNGNYSFVGGKNNDVVGPTTFAYGEYLKNYSDITSPTGNTPRTVFGKYNDIADTMSSIFSVGIGTSNNDRKNAFSIYATGKSHFIDSIQIGALDSNGNPTWEPTNQLDLVNKYYVDQRTGLYKGILNYNNSDFTSDANGSLYSVTNASGVFRYRHYSAPSLSSTGYVSVGSDEYVLGIKKDDNIISYYDVLAFTTDTSKINPINVIGKANSISTPKPAIHLHKIAQTGNYNDLTNRPNIPSEQVMHFGAQYNISPTGTYPNNITGITLDSLTQGGDVNQKIYDTVFGGKYIVVLDVRYIPINTTNVERVDYYICNSINDLQSSKKEAIFNKVENTDMNINPNTPVIQQNIKSYTIRGTFATNTTPITVQWRYSYSAVSNNFNELINTPQLGEVNNVVILDAVVDSNTSKVTDVKYDGNNVTFEMLDTAFSKGLVFLKISTYNPETSTPENHNYGYLLGTKIENHRYEFRGNWIYYPNNSELGDSFNKNIIYQYYIKIYEDSTHPNTPTVADSSIKLYDKIHVEFNDNNTSVTPQHIQTFAISDSNTQNSYNNIIKLSKVAGSGRYDDLLDLPDVVTSTEVVDIINETNNNSISYHNHSFQSVGVLHLNPLRVSVATNTSSYRHYYNVNIQDNFTINIEPSLSLNTEISNLLSKTNIIRVYNSSTSTKTITLSFNASSYLAYHVVSTTDTFSIEGGEIVEFSFITVPSFTQNHYDICFTQYEGMRYL